MYHVADLAAAVAALRKRIHYPVLAPDELQAVQKASFMICVEESREVTEGSKRIKIHVAAGMGFFYRPFSAISCAHCLPADARVVGTKLTAVEGGMLDDADA